MGSDVKMFVGTCMITLFIHGNRSLKGKRSIINRIKSRVKNTFNVSIAEVGDNDLYQKAALGISAVSGDRVYLEGQLGKIINFIDGLTEAKIADAQTMIELKGGDDHVFLQTGRQG